MPQPQSSKQVLTSILTSLQTLQPAPTTTSATHPPRSNLTHLAEEQQQTAKKVLLTLHFLFPHELLPALDILDRGLVTHLFCPSPQSSKQDITTSEELESDAQQPQHSNPQPEPGLEVYYVQSSSSTLQGPGTSKSRFRNALPSAQSYEVRLDSWNCTCPAFAYSALRLMMREIDLDAAMDVDTAGLEGHGEGNGHGHAQHEEGLGLGQEETGVEGKSEWLFGGTTTKHDAIVPVCKHILAVTLGKAAPGLFGHGVVRREVEREELAGWAAGWGEH